MSNIVYKKNVFSTPFLRGYRELKIPILDPGGHSVWPEIFPVARIDALRDTVGMRHFSSQMMLEYVPPERTRLDPGAIHLYSDEFDLHHARLGVLNVTGVTAYWDPSMGARKSDGSVCVILYRDDRAHRAFIHDILYLTVDEGDMHPLGHQCEQVLEFLQRYNMHSIIIETNGLGNALPEIMRDIVSHHGGGISVQKITNNKNKSDRILDAIEPMLTTGRLYAHTRVSQTPFMSEMMGWTPLGGVGHDDGLDAVAGAICARAVPVRPIGWASIRNAKTDFNI